MGQIIIGKTKHDYSFSMNAIENIITELADGEFQKMEALLAKVTIDVSQERMTTDAIKMCRVVAFHGILSECRKKREECPFIDSEDFGNYIESFNSIVPVFTEFAQRLFGFFQEGAATPKPSEKKVLSTTTRTRTPKN